MKHSWNLVEKNVNTQNRTCLKQSSAVRKVDAISPRRPQFHATDGQTNKQKDNAIA